MALLRHTEDGTDRHRGALVSITDGGVTVRLDRMPPLEPDDLVDLVWRGSRRTVRVAGARPPDVDLRFETELVRTDDRVGVRASTSIASAWRSADGRTAVEIVDVSTSGARLVALAPIGWQVGDVGDIEVARDRLAAVVVHVGTNTAGAEVAGIEFSFVAAAVNQRLERLVERVGNGMTPWP